MVENGITVDDLVKAVDEVRDRRLGGVARYRSRGVPADPEL